MLFRFLDEHPDRGPVRLLGEALGVAPAGSYARRDWPARARPQRQEASLVAIRAIPAACHARSGCPRGHADPAARGQGCCVNTVAPLRRANAIWAKTAKKCRCTTDSNHDRLMAEHLLDRPVAPGFPRGGGRTSSTSPREGGLYRAAVEDRSCRRVVGGAMADHLASRLVVDALGRF